MTPFCRERRQALIKDFKRDELDALVVSDPVNIRYLTGFTGESSYLVVGAKHTILVSDSRFEQQIRDECGDLDAVIRGHDRTTEDALAETLTKGKFEVVGVEASHLTLAHLETLKTAATKAEFVPTKGRVEEGRVIKDASEIEMIRKAVAIAERAFGMFSAMLRDVDTEKDLVDAMETYIRRAGGEKSSFPIIAAVGTRSALPHAPPTQQQLIEGSKLLIDWGARYHGYHSDLTRMIRNPFLMVPSSKNRRERVGYDYRKIHEIVLEAQMAAIEVIRDGASARDVDAAARKVIADAGFASCFNHGLGHGLGLEVHEAPRVRKNSDDVLKSGMVITIEPGIYIPGWGGVRIEDDILVLKDGCTVLSSLPKSAPPDDDE
jgi:Xaa-Pro aminopeptidase